MRTSGLATLLLGLTARLVEACNELSLGFGSPGTCVVDPNDGSKYGVYAAVQQPCAPNEVLYLSLSYTAPDGYITRTETSAQLGTASPFTTTFTFDIPQTFFANGAVITQTYQFDNSPPATAVTTTKSFVTTNFVVPRVSTSTVLVESTLTYTYTATYSDYVTIPHTTTIACNTGVRTVATVTTTSSYTFSSYLPPSIAYTPSTTTLTQTIPCTLVGGGLPSPFRPREGQYETDLCLSKAYPPSTSYSTGPPMTTVTTQTYYYDSNVDVSKTTTITFSDITKTECNKPTGTVTYTYTKVFRTIVTPSVARVTTTRPSYVYKYTTVGLSQC